MAEPVVIQYTKGALAGAEYEIESAAVAKKAHPDATIVRFARTGEPFKEGEKPTPPAVEPVALDVPAETIAPHVAEDAPKAAKK